jgi:hypothetical protein
VPVGQTEEEAAAAQQLLNRQLQVQQGVNSRVQAQLQGLLALLRNEDGLYDHDEDWCGLLLVQRLSDGPLTAL